MTARDVIAGLVAEWRLRAAQQWNRADDASESGRDGDYERLAAHAVEAKRCADELESTLAQPSGEAVAWQRRWEGSGPQRGWHIVEAKRLHNNNTVAYLGDGIAEAEVDAIVEAHNAALYTTPPAPLGGLTEGEREALEFIDSPGTYAALNLAGHCYFVPKVQAICAALRRLTAPRAEGVDAERKVAMALAVAMTPHVEPRKVWKGLGSNERKHYDSLAQAAIAALAQPAAQGGDAGMVRAARTMGPIAAGLLTPHATDAEGLRDDLERAEAKLMRAGVNAYVTEALHFVRSALERTAALAPQRKEGE